MRGLELFRHAGIGLSLSSVIVVGGLTASSSGQTPASPVSSPVQKSSAPTGPAPTQVLEKAKPTVSAAEAKKWELLSPVFDITKDGHWLSFTIRPVDGDPRLTIKNNDTPEKWSIEGVVNSAFSDDCKWAGYVIAPPKAVADLLRDQKKPVETKFGLRDLSNGNERIYEGVVSFHFLKGSKTLFLQRSHAVTRAEPVSDLTLVNLTTGESLTIGNVLVASASKDGAYVVASIQSDRGEKGVQVIDTDGFRIRTILWGKDDISGLQWADKANVLGLLVGKVDEKKDGAFNSIVVATGLAGKISLTTFDPEQEKDFPKGRRISEVGFDLNNDGSRVAFGVHDWTDKPKPVKGEEKAHPEVWNTHDLRVVPQQRVMAGADKVRPDRYLWTPGAKTYRCIAAGELQSVEYIGDYQKALMIDRQPYASPVTNGYEFEDVYLVDTETGSKKRILEKNHWPVIASRKGNYLSYYQGRRWWLYDVAADKSTNPLLSVKTTFEDVEDDHTTPEKPPAGMPVWLADDAGVIVRDYYDNFLLNPKDGKVVQLTEGRKDNVTFQFNPIEAEEDGPSLAKPFYFHAFDEDTKGSGYYTADRFGKGKMLIFDQRQISGLKKATNSDRVAFRMETFTDSPNLYVTNTAFSQIKPETKTNPQQKDFAWGKTELIQYKSRWGKALQGILIYPADYKATRHYPMVTYIYERMSQGLNQYVAPSEFSAYNPQWLSQNGYFVYLPDIAYRGRTPGENAVNCLEPAVTAVLNKHVGVDSDRIGLMGHSWGAYQTAFVTTVSKVFRVGVAGAPLTDLVSMYNTHYWNMGITNQPLLETGQGRLEVPFWEDPKIYLQNSPVWESQKRKAPILITVGDQDGAVDYHQGIALYNTLRRMGKDAVLLVYYGENHNFTKKADQLDYAHRVRHYLDVYLKGAKPEPWVSEGVPFIKKDDN